MDLDLSLDGTNKKGSPPRNERSDLIRARVNGNDERIKAQTKKDVTLRKAVEQELRIPVASFWRLMETYKLLSRATKAKEPIMGVKQISERIKGPAQALNGYKVLNSEFWWVHVEDPHEGPMYQPVLDNAKNAILASGVFHHFFFEKYRDVQERNDLFDLRVPTAKRMFKDVDQLNAMLEKHDPFAPHVRPKALLVIQRTTHYSNPSFWDSVTECPSITGTYALVQTVTGTETFIRPSRLVDQQQRRVTVQREHDAPPISLPLLGDERVYASTKSGLSLYSNKSGREYSFKLKCPGVHEPVLGDVIDLSQPWYETKDLLIHPIRYLLPPPEISTFLDYGAVWSGCMVPTGADCMSMCELEAHFELQGVDPQIPNYFFQSEKGERSVDSKVTAEQYIRFMSWFAAFPGGVGPDYCWLRLLYNSLHPQVSEETHWEESFSIMTRTQMGSSELVPGTNSVRLGTTMPQCLVVDVLCQDESVLSHRIKVNFHGDGTDGSTVSFDLIYETGEVVLQQANNLIGPLHKRIADLSAVPALYAFQPAKPKHTYLKWQSSAGGSQRTPHNGGDHPMSSGLTADAVAGGLSGGGGSEWEGESFFGDSDDPLDRWLNEWDDDAQSGTRGRSLSTSDEGRRVRQRT